MTQIKTKSADILAVEIPNYVLNWQSLDIKLDWSAHKIIGKLSELTDIECKEFVEKHPNIQYRDYMVSTLSKSINGWTVNWVKPTAKESFLTLLQSEGIDTSKEWLIILVC